MVATCLASVGYDRTLTVQGDHDFFHSASQVEYCPWPPLELHFPLQHERLFSSLLQDSPSFMQSVTVGSSLGRSDGLIDEDGSSLGRSDGLADTVGSSLGRLDGDDEGASLGTDDGANDSVGSSLGSLDGLNDTDGSSIAKPTPRFLVESTLALDAPL